MSDNVQFADGYTGEGVVATDEGYMTTSNLSEFVNGGSGALSGSPTGGTPPTSDSGAISMAPQPEPLADFSYRLVDNMMVEFTNLSVSATDFSWDFGDGSLYQDKSVNPVHVFSAPGSYTVVLTIDTPSGGYSTKAAVVEVEFFLPTPEFSLNADGHTQYFSNDSKLPSSDPVLWDFGDGNTSSEADPSHAYDGNGTYTVTMTQGDFTTTQEITVDVGITLSCDASTGAEGYKWEVSTDGVSGWSEIDDTVDPTVNITEGIHGVDSTELNYFRVKAYSEAGDSDYTTAVSQQCNV